MKVLKTVLQEHKKTFLVIVIFLLSALGIAARDYLNKPQNPAAVMRQGEGEDRESRTFSYQIDGGERQEIVLEVNPVERSEESAENLLEQAAAEWEGMYLGENESENSVCGALKLPDQFCDGLVTVSYESSDYDILDTDGSIFRERIPKDGALVELTAEFTYASYSRRESRWLRVIPPKQDSLEWISRQLKEEAVEAEKSTREKETFLLPTELEGHRILWEKQEESQWIYLVFLGIVAAFCLEWRTKETQKRVREERNNRLLSEYPQMVEQMSLLLGSGMTIRGAWKRMLLTEQKMRKESNQKMNLFIEEMWITYREIAKGCGEREAYERFGSRIGLIAYRRFGMILSQNLSKGTRDVRELLQRETEEALEMRKNRARKLGEEADTKLLFPMLLMFVLILLVLLVPAMQSFL